jgi:hypothetical protein
VNAVKLEVGLSVGNLVLRIVHSKTWNVWISNPLLPADLARLATQMDHSLLLLLAFPQLHHKHEAPGREAAAEAGKCFCKLFERGVQCASSEASGQTSKAYSSWQAAAYGACVNAKYLEVGKDMCKAEFDVFKACVTKVVSDCMAPARSTVGD